MHPVHLVNLISCLSRLSAEVEFSPTQVEGLFWQGRVYLSWAVAVDDCADRIMKPKGVLSKKQEEQNERKGKMFHVVSRSNKQ